MNIQVRYGNTQWETVKFTTFSDGCENCELPKVPKDITYVGVDIHESTRDIIRLLLVKEAIDNHSWQKTSNIGLRINYLPNARADRRFVDGMAHPMKVFAKLINSCKFSEVVCYDPHSDVAEALIDNFYPRSQTEALQEKLPLIRKQYTNNFILVAPDLGAAKKMDKVARDLEHKDYVQALKIRDVTTGNITKCDLLPYDVTGKDLLIVDDIADGGASFKYLAKMLKGKGATRVGLYVTHGIFSKGLDVLKVDIDYICCNNIVCNYVNHQDISNFNNKVGE